mgnify:CR=1 FL=1
MAKFKKNKSGDLPAISTASLPDIVFMLLFFFMVATVMRDSTLMVQNTLPAADQVQKLDKKDRVIYIYAGKPSSRYQDKYGDQPRIQLNDKFATVADPHTQGANQASRKYFLDIFFYTLSFYCNTLMK